MFCCLHCRDQKEMASFQLFCGFIAVILCVGATSKVASQDDDEASTRPVVGYPCANNKQCQLLDKNSQCDAVNGVCDCQTGLIAVRGRCQATSELGQRCLRSTQCVTDNTVCKQNYCACIEGLIEYGGQCVKQTPILTSISEQQQRPEFACKVDSECNTNYCYQSKCICPTGTVPLNGECGGVLNMPCQTLGQCRALLSGSFCDVSLSRTCICDDGFVATDDGRSCIRVLGSNCKRTRECATLVRNSECKLVGSQRTQCACVAGLRPNFLDRLDASTRCQETIGAPCNADTQCNTFVDFSRCAKNSSLCACNDGYEYDPVTLTCNEANKIARIFNLPHTAAREYNSNGVDERLTLTISGSIHINTDSNNNNGSTVQIANNGPAQQATIGNDDSKITNTQIAGTCTFPDRYHGCIGSRCLFDGFSCDATNSVCKKINSNNPSSLLQCVCMPGFQQSSPLACVAQSSTGGGGGNRERTTSTTTTTTQFPSRRLACGVAAASLDPFSLRGQRITSRLLFDRERAVDVNFTDSDLIVGGTDVRLDQVCWQVGLQTNRGNGLYSMCGGSILSGAWILTAGHCVIEGDKVGDKQAEARNVFVVIGSTTNQPGDVPSGSSCAKRIRAKRVIPHPEYTVLKDRFGNFEGILNDIALIELTESIDLTSQCACPVCLASKLPGAGEVGVISGYGCQTSDCSDQSSIQPRKLQYARVAFVPNTSKSCFGTETSQLAQRYVCVGGKFGVDACPGDSGGPFVAYDQFNSAHYQVGIASFVVGNSDSICAVGNPARYTKIQYYLSWIRQFVPDAQVIQ